MSDRHRSHKLILDLYDWGDESIPPHKITLTIDEAKLATAIGQAIGRHDKTKTFCNGGIVIHAEPTGKPGDLFSPPDSS